MDYAKFFVTATGHEPYPYQVRAAVRKVLPSLLSVPTGAGKTEAAVLAWLYRYVQHPDPQTRVSTPRRLVYCLPMRTLVEQTANRVKNWLRNLGKAHEVGVTVLMGGEPLIQWYLYPEESHIIIGTQDMLLSRALNRGYGSSPFMWPIEYGLLNNDCLWVLDEVQLMATGLPTSTQLAGLRHKLKTFGPAQSLWMSATVNPGWLDTIDHEAPSESQLLELGPDDLADAHLKKRHIARKKVTEIPIDRGKGYARKMAEFIAENHRCGSMTLAIVNTVERSQEVYKALNNSKWVSLEARKLLIHSRFRGQDREQKQDLLSTEIDATGPGTVVVATQAVEAGVDISARTLVTELAPWSSMVQRFGRCNRRGEYEQGGDIFWIDTGERSQDIAPYDPEDIEPARQLMKSLNGRSAGPSDIEKLDDVMGDADHLSVIRRRDVVGLFDTTPDLSGSFLDVSQYVRGINERDVSVFWRNIPAEGPGEEEPKPIHSETVSVPRFGKGLDDYLKIDMRKAWRWDFLDNGWIQVQLREIHAGMTVLLDAAHGGYTPEAGWDPASGVPVDVIPDTNQGPEDGQSTDPLSTGRKWVTLSEHTRHVEREVKKILDELSKWLDESAILEAIGVAARYHDTGKAHPAFQEMLRKTLSEEDAALRTNVLMAKSPGNGRMDDSRRHFRHELGSILVLLEHANELGERGRDLAAYLAASHHGKVRLGIRSLPGRRRGLIDSNPEPNLLLGYRLSEPETIPVIELGEGTRVGPTTLDLSLARIGLGEDGKRSWLERTLGLLEWLGPFRLAYLEAILRAADMRASKEEQEEQN